MFNTYSLSQLVLEATSGDNILDLVLASDELLVSNMSIGPPLGSSDHSAISFSLNCALPTSTQTTFPNFRNGDYTAMLAFLAAIDWETVLDRSSVESMWCDIKNILEIAIHLFVPKRAKRPPRVQTSRSARKAHRKRKRMHRNHKRRNTAQSKALLDEASCEFRAACRHDVLSSELNVLASGNLGEVFRFARTKLVSKESVPTLRLPDGTVCESPAAKCKALSSQFQSQFTVSDGNLPQFASRTANRLADINIDVLNVYFALSHLPNKYSCGPDGIPPVLLKNCAVALAYPLCELFVKSFDTGEVPADWSKAIVSPLFKRKGKNSDPKNYRPVSLTSVACKTFEAIIKRQLLDFLKFNSLISPKQHGFLSKKSTLTNTMRTLNSWFKACDKKKVVHSVFLDFAKAFDTVSHEKLLHKIKGYGISGKLHRWLEAFLAGRTQQVVVDSVLSNIVPVTSGVPQGSVLGPILFLLYINDLPDIVHADVDTALFADDSKLSTACAPSCSTDPSLSMSLSNCQSWSDTWQLTLAENKCEVFCFGKTTSDLSYDINGISLPLVQSVNDLGVLLSSDMKSSAHCETLAKKCSKICCHIFRTFRCRKYSFLRDMFNVFVLPILSYNCPVWSPHLLKDVKIVESVLRAYTKRFPGLWDVPYHERLRRLGMRSLQELRLRSDLILTYKIIHHLIDLDFDEFFSYSLSATRNHGFKLFKPHVSLSSTQNFFNNRIINPWNALPKHVVNAPSLDSFSSLLDTVDLTHFLPLDLATL